MNRPKFTYSLLILLYLILCNYTVYGGMSSVQSFETPYTISLVKTGKIDGEKVIVGSSYDGTVICLDYSGNILWENPLSGYYNQDMFLYDVDEDGSDEVLVACADGAAYCVDNDGQLLWGFKKNDVPMYAITAMKNCGKVVVFCGGFDCNIYCLSPECSLLNTVATSEFTLERAWGDMQYLGYKCNVGWLRPVQLADGKELLAIQGCVYTMGANNGRIHLLDFDIDNNSYKFIKDFTDLGVEVVTEVDGQEKITLNAITSVSHFEVYHNDGVDDRLLLGGASSFIDLNIGDGTTTFFDAMSISGSNSKGETLVEGFGYRASQPFIVKDRDDPQGYRYFYLFGSRIIMLDSDMKSFDRDKDVIIVDYSFNNACYDKDNNDMVLASSQSGGNSIHLIDLDNPEWCDEMRHFTSPGGISKILENSADLASALTSFQKPIWEGVRPEVIFLSDSKENLTVASYENKYRGVVSFYDTNFSIHSEETSYRDTMTNARARNSRDSRKSYSLTVDESVDELLLSYRGGVGTAINAGHGNDPYYFSMSTWNKLFHCQILKMCQLC